MSKELFKALLEIPQVVEIINKWVLIINKDIKRMLNMLHINSISVNAVNKIPLRKDGRKKRDQTSKYTILRNGTYYVHHYWEKNQKVREKVAVTCPTYFHEGCGLKLVLHTYIYKIIPKNRSGVEVNFDVIWSNIQVDK